MTREHALRALAPRPGERILDAACGTGGLLADLAARHSGLSLTGVDCSPPMLKRAREKLPAAVTLVEGHIQRIPLPDAAFNAVTCLNALHYCTNPETVLNEFIRVLVPGGRLVIVDWRRDWLMMPLLAGWLQFRNRAMGRLMGARELASIARSAGFAIDRIDTFRIRPAWRLMGLRAHKIA